jgi:dual specificity tyrosine-phosphorylation-regulated kinase 2/3/4
MAERFVPTKSVKTLPAVPGEHLLPMNSEEVFLKFESVVSKFELAELTQYPIIYYLGLKAKKLRPNDKLKNKGFDDKNTDYILVPGDQIAYQYEILELLGSGSFSQVCKCFDHKGKREVAVKIIKSHKRFEEQGQVELKVLAYVRKHDKGTHFVQMLSYFMFRGHLCIVFELLSFNLYDLLKANSFKGFSNTLVRRFILQVLKGLCFLKDHQIVHCDLKPENIILANGKESIIKIIDLGSSCFESEKLYFYIQSRIYRAPEIILGISYTTAIDMWSLGCIVAELLTGDPLFQGESEADQLFAIMEILGYPPVQMIEDASKKAKFFNEENIVKNNMNSRGKLRVPASKTLEDKVDTDDFVLIDFLKSKD